MVQARRIETARLRLRPIAAADADDLHRLWTDPDVRRYLWDDVVIPRAQTDAIVRDSMALFRAQGLGLWAVCLRSADTLIGFCGYWFFHDPPELQLLYGLAPAFWGRGLATESARAMIRYGIEELGLDRVVASTDAPNAASRRVLEKAGMVFEKQVQIGGRATVYYVLPDAAHGPGEGHTG